jgi:hypothetical protein
MALTTPGRFITPTRSRFVALRWPQHDPPHQAGAGALDARDQLRLPGRAAVFIVMHPIEDGPDRRNALRGVRLARR